MSGGVRASCWGTLAGGSPGRRAPVGGGKGLRGEKRSRTVPTITDHGTAGVRRSARRARSASEQRGRQSLALAIDERAVNALALEVLRDHACGFGHGMIGEEAGNVDDRRVV